MKYLSIFLFILLPVFVQAEFLCPASLTTHSTPLEQMESPSFWSFCTEMDLITAKKGFEFKAAAQQFESQDTSDYTKVLAAIESSRGEHEPLVQVSSVYLDAVTGQPQRVYGVGTLIVTGTAGPIKAIEPKEIAAGRYFVLTAGHVSNGLELKVTSSDRNSIPLKALFYDHQNDLTLLEIDKKSLGYLSYPLGYYLTANGQGITVMPLTSALSDSRSTPDRNATTLHDIVSGSDFKSAPIEGSVSTGASSVIIASWLQRPQFVDLLYRLNLLVPRNQNEESVHIQRSFPRGFSGSPIGISYKSNLNYSGVIYSLGGILTLSDFNQSQGSGTGPIQRFIGNVIGSQYQLQGPRPIWFLFNNRFAKLQDGTLTIFEKTGPIGNGIVIDGAVAPSNGESAYDVDKEWVKALRQERLESGDIETLRKELKTLKDQPLRSEQLQQNLRGKIRVEIR